MPVVATMTSSKMRCVPVLPAVREAVDAYLAAAPFVTAPAEPLLARRA